MAEWHPGQTSCDKTETITPTYDGDGGMAKRVDAKSRTIFPANTTTTTSATEYYVGSTVLGKVLTDLNSTGGKKLTRIFTGDGILAEQQNFPADSGHSSAWSEVFWKHEDLVTGSYSKIIRNGTKLNAYDPPSEAAAGRGQTCDSAIFTEEAV